MRNLFFIAGLIFATPALAMTPHEIFMEQVHSFWGANIVEEDLNIITGKFNSDDDDDYVGWHVTKEALELIAVVKSEKYNVQIANVRIPITDSSICTHVPFVNFTPWSDAEKKAVGLNNVGPNAIRINGGKCERIYLFWPDNVPHATVDLRIPRN